MTDYNDGTWHGWNGGECPVHPKSLVEASWRFHEGTWSKRPDVHEAGGLIWNINDHGAITAFRVVKPYREPPKQSEWWGYFMRDNNTPAMWDTKSDAEKYAQGRTVFHIVVKPD